MTGLEFITNGGYWMKEKDKKTNRIEIINKSKSFKEAYGLLKIIPLEQRENSIYNSVINKSKTFNEALIVLDDMSRDKIKINDKIVRTFLMRTKNESEVLYLLEKIDYKSLKLNKTTYREILLKLKSNKAIKDVFNDMKELVIPNSDMYQVVIYKSKKFYEIIPYINELKDIGIKLDDRICSTIINKSDNFYDAILFVYDMIDQKIKVRNKIYVTLISLVSNQIELEELTTLLNNQRKLDVFEDEIVTKYNKKKKEIEDITKTKAIINYEKKEEFKEGQSCKISRIKKVDSLELKKRYSSLYDNISLNDSFYIINSNEPLHDHINFLCSEINVIDINIAIGFLYKSGLEMMSPSFEKSLNNKGTIRMVVGSLQKYNKYIDSDLSKIHSMDNATAKYLNNFILNDSVELNTIEQRFFHGKFYILEGVNKSCIIIGSSNISSSGFEGNHEFNILYILNSKSDLFKQFKQEFRHILNDSISIDSINPDRFIEFTNEQDQYGIDTSITMLNQNDVRNRIEQLSEEQIRRRLKMWMQRNPTNIYSDLKIKSLKEYILFEYQDYNLLILESFDSGNAYYYFTNMQLEELIKTIKNLSKTEIFALSNMKKRGYHVKNDSSLELSIASLFIKKLNNDKFNIF